MIRKWEIWWAYVKFEDSDQVKKRPVVVLSENISFIVSFKITGTDRGDLYPEHKIREWKICGLKKASFIRCYPIKIDKSKFVEKIGKLSPLDQLLLEQKLLSK